MASGNIAKNWMVRIGNLVEESIAKGIYELGQEAPILVGEPAEKVWYQVPVPEGKCGDGSDYHIYVRKGTSGKLCVFFSGGGIAINEYMAARPVTGGSVAAWVPNYYWNNLRLFTQVMNINAGITKNGADNPFDDWNFLVITYATGDMHIGRSEFTYHVVEDSEDGSVKAFVKPTQVPMDNPLSTVRNEFNAIYLHCNMADKILLTGRGAGKDPTGSAMAADIVDLA